MRKKFTISSAKPFSMLLLLFFISKINAQVSVTQGFEVNNPFLPQGWALTSLPQGVQNYWNGTAGAANQNNSPGVMPHGGARVARFKAYNNVPGISQSLITSVINYSGLGSNQAHFSFWMFRDSTSLNFDSLAVFVNIDTSLTNATKIGVVARCNSINLPDIVAANTWNQYTFNIPTSYNTDTNFIILKGYGDAGKNIYIDDVEYDTYPPVCAGQPIAGILSSAISTICGGSGSTQLSLNGSSFGASGLNLQWQMSITPTGPWFDTLANAINMNTGIISNPIFYRCYIDCISSGLSDTSNVILVDVSSNPIPTLTVSPTGAGPQGNQISYCVGTLGVMVSVAGANTYTWSPALGLSATTGDSVLANPTANTTYTILGTDVSGCTAQKTIVVAPRNAPNFTLSTTADTICAGDSITINATTGGGGFGTTYTWEPGAFTGNAVTISPTESTLVMVTATNTAGCSKMDSVAITVNAAPTVDFNFVASDSSVSFTDASVNAMSWLWNFGDGNQSTIQNPNHVFDTVGVYNVQLTVTTLCGFDSVSKIITILPNGISELSQSKFIKIYPNPASNLLYLQSKFISNAIISIFDNQGREVFANFKNSINNETKLIDISSLESGFYFVKVNATNGIETVFFTKQ